MSVCGFYDVSVLLAVLHCCVIVFPQAKASFYYSRILQVVVFRERARTSGLTLRNEQQIFACFFPFHSFMLPDGVYPQSRYVNPRSTSPQKLHNTRYSQNDMHRFYNSIVTYSRSISSFFSAVWGHHAFIIGRQSYYVARQNPFFSLARMIGVTPII